MWVLAHKYKSDSANRGCRLVAIDNNGTCLALLNRDVYGSHFENSALYMSLVRGVTYCAHPIGESPLIPMDRFTKKRAFSLISKELK